MRGFLFRGKRVDNGEWIEGDLLQYLSSSKVHIVQNYLGAGGKEVIPETVGACTYLTDKKGKRIFEGDIVKRGFELYIVRWNEEQFKYDFYTANGSIQSGFNIFAKYYTEVIGNIHDNPDLLKG